jgi:hypothetical protein
MLVLAHAAQDAIAEIRQSGEVFKTRRKLNKDSNSKKLSSKADLPQDPSFH